jgi:hypothetical protein
MELVRFVPSADIASHASPSGPGSNCVSGKYDDFPLNCDASPTERNDKTAKVTTTDRIARNWVARECLARAVGHH